MLSLVALMTRAIGVGSELLIEHGHGSLYLLHTKGELTVVPLDFLTNGYTYSDGRFVAKLSTGNELVLNDIQSVSEECPVELPTFLSYKFNDKYNYQLFKDVASKNPESEHIELEVGGIGKRLTASFKLPDKDVLVWANNQLQQSKQSRLRFDHPVTYTIGRAGWRQLELNRSADGNTDIVYQPFGHRTTVTVDWLTDHSTNTYAVPEVYITTLDGTTISSKKTYWDATIEIRGGGVYPDMPKTLTQVRGRGNNTWDTPKTIAKSDQGKKKPGRSTGKNPYRIKFPTAQKPLGMTKGRNWVLLSNKQDGSMTTNALGHKIASLMGAEFPCHIVPVELYVNGIYQGSYNLCEKVSIAKNSIALKNDSNAALIELDTYRDAGKRKNRTNVYHISSKLKSPSIKAPDYHGTLTYREVIQHYNRMMRKVHHHPNDYLRYVDLNALVGFLATTELSAQSEVKHPKSVFVFNENVKDNFLYPTADPTPWKFGPFWDCDWAFGYQQSHQYFIEEAHGDFFSDLIGHGKPKMLWNDLRNAKLGSTADKAYRQLWHEFIERGGIDELLEFCDDYYAYAKPSLLHNNQGQYANDPSDYAEITAISKRWLRTRAFHIYCSICAYDLQSKYQFGDENGNGSVTCNDLALLIDELWDQYLEEHGTMDVNADGAVNQLDIEHLLRNYLNKTK